MSEGKTLALFVLILVAFCLWLQYQNKLIPTYQAMTGPTPTGTNARPFYQYGLAIAGFVFISSFLPGDGPEILAGLIVIEALLHNTASGHNVVKDILG